MFIYIASSDINISLKCYKIGCSSNLPNRLKACLTFCNPNEQPNHDIKFIHVWETTAMSQIELLTYERDIHDIFISYRYCL